MAATTPPAAASLCAACSKELDDRWSVSPVFCCGDCSAELCLACFLARAEPGRHKASHAYRIRSSRLELTADGWSARDDLAMLEAIERVGFGNWGDVAEALGRGHSALECQAHYLDVFADRYGTDIPAKYRFDNDGPWHDEHDDEHQEEDDDDDREEERGGANGGEKKNDHAVSLAAAAALDDDDDPRRRRPPVDGGGGRDGLPGGLSLLAPPAPPSGDESEKKIERGRTRPLPRKGTPCRRSAPRPTVSDAELSTRHSAFVGADLFGYMPLRGDFDVEHDNDAELFVADVEVRPDDDDADRALKRQVLRAYDAKLDERERRKRFVVDGGLLDERTRRNRERATPRDRRAVERDLFAFARFRSEAEHDTLVRGVVDANRLQRKVQLLKDKIQQAEKHDASRRGRPRPDGAARLDGGGRPEGVATTNANANANAERAAFFDGAYHPLAGGGGGFATNGTGGGYANGKTPLAEAGRGGTPAAAQTGIPQQQQQPQSSFARAAAPPQQQHYPSHHPHQQGHPSSKGRRYANGYDAAANGHVAAARARKRRRRDDDEGHVSELERRICEALQLPPRKYVEVKEALTVRRSISRSPPSVPPSSTPVARRPASSPEEAPPPPSSARATTSKSTRQPSSTTSPSPPDGSRRRRRRRRERGRVRGISHQARRRERPKQSRLSPRSSSEKIPPQPSFEGLTWERRRPAGAARRPGEARMGMVSSGWRAGPGRGFSLCGKGSSEMTCEATRGTAISAACHRVISI